MTVPRGARMRMLALLVAVAMVGVACGTRLDRAQVLADADSSVDGAPTQRPAPSAGASGAGRTSGPTGTPTDGRQPTALVPPGTATEAPGTDPSNGPATDEPVAPVNGVGVTDTEIKIGVTAPLSGITAFMGDETVGPLNAFLDFVNATQGGLNGRKLTIISYDDRADPTQTLANIKRLVEQDEVFMVVGAFTDSALEYVRQKNVPLMTFGGTAPPFSSRYPSVFPLVGNALTFQQEGAWALVNNAKKRPKRVAILYDTETFDVRGYLDHFRDTWERLGATVVTTDPLNLSDGDCTSLALKVQRLDIDYWDFQGLGWLHCMPAMERIGWQPPLGVGGWVTALAEFGNIVGPNIAGVWGPSTGDLTDGSPRTFTAAHKQYQDVIAQFAPAINSKTHLESPQQISMWVGGNMIVDGLRAIAPAYTRERFVDWMHDIDGYDVGIQPPIISLAPDCKRGAGGTWWAQWQWDEGKQEAFRTPETPYLGGFWADDLGGPCYVTRIADELVGN